MNSQRKNKQMPQQEKRQFLHHQIHFPVEILLQKTALMWKGSQTRHPQIKGNRRPPVIDTVVEDERDDPLRDIRQAKQ